MERSKPILGLVVAAGVAAALSFSSQAEARGTQELLVADAALAGGVSTGGTCVCPTYDTRDGLVRWRDDNMTQAACEGGRVAAAIERRGIRVTNPVCIFDADNK